MGEDSRRNAIIAAVALSVAAIAVVLVIVLSGGDDEGTPSAPTQASTTGTEAGTKTPAQGKKGSHGSTENPATPGSQEQRTRQLTPTIRQRVAGSGLETIRVRDGAPVGGLLRLVYRSGDRVRLRILPDRSGRFVIAPLGLEERGGPPDGATFDFIAKQSGLFGVEMREGGARTRVAVLVIH